MKYLVPREGHPVLGPIIRQDRVRHDTSLRTPLGIVSESSQRGSPGSQALRLELGRPGFFSEMPVYCICETSMVFDS